MWNRKELKQKGKAAFLANYWKTVLVAILMTALVLGSVSYSSSTVRHKLDNPGQTAETPVDVSVQNDQILVNGERVESIQDAVNAIGQSVNASPEDIASVNSLIDALQNDPATREAAFALLAIIGGLLLAVLVITSLLRLLVFNPLEVGCQNYFLRNAEAPAELNTLGRGFHPYWRTVWTLFLRGIFLFLWSLLFIVPGIVKSYSYRMVPFLLADHPELSGTEAITLSRQMMNGHKWNAFVLDLSFLGWHILSILTLGLLGIFFVNPYQLSTDAELYRVLSAKE